MENDSEKIRRSFDEKSWRWLFGVVDCIAIFSESTDPRNYWKVLKNRLKKTDNELVTRCNQLKLKARDGKMYMTDVANAETISKILQGIPKARFEEFERWASGLDEPKINSDAELLLDIFQKDGHLYVEAMIPGASKDDVKLSVFPTKIIIRGEIKNPDTSSGKKYLQQELNWLTFARIIELPFSIKEESVEIHEERGHFFFVFEKI